MSSSTDQYSVMPSPVHRRNESGHDKGRRHENTGTNSTAPDQISSSESEQSRQSSATNSPPLLPEVPSNGSGGSYFRKKRNLNENNDEPVQSDEAVTKAQHEMFDLNEKAMQQSIQNRTILLDTLRETSHVGKLSMINLTRRSLGPREATVLARAIEQNKHLLVLKLSYNRLGDRGAEILSEAIASNGRHHKQLSMLDLGFNGIGDKGCEALATKVLAGNTVLQSLYLSGNAITETGALSIAAAIFQGTSLQTLHLSGNRLGVSGTQAISSAMIGAGSTGPPSRPCQISTLFLDNTSMKSEGFVSVPNMMLSYSHITTLNLSNNEITDNDILSLSHALTQNKMIPLEELQLSFNQITCEGVESLMNSIWGSQTLRRLKLDNNRIQDRGAQLCAVVLTSISLEVLDIGFNRVSTVGIKALMKNISENDSLQSLSICGIPIDQTGAKALSFALAYNCSLRTIYMDNCSAGYSAQRHIVAGVVSNRLLSLRNITGFDVGPIASTLGVPKLPERWSNEQVLGFFRLMWQQWILKSSKGGPVDNSAFRGPAPPAAVASAAKIAFASLGALPESLFQCEIYERPLSERPPIDPPSASLMERSLSGTIRVPEFTSDLSAEVGTPEGTERQDEPESPYRVSVIRDSINNPEKRNRNLKILRQHFRALNDIGHLPFNNADLWQLHQYFFSPPYQDDSVEAASLGDSSDMSQAALTLSSSASMDHSLFASQLSSALAIEAAEHSSHSHKRRSDEDHNTGLEEPSAKRAKYLKPRIAYYPRIMAKIRSLGNRPMDKALSLLRQLKYTENIFFSGKCPYTTESGAVESYSDIEMILLDLL